MPSKSKAQQALMGMALAVRKGELARSKVDKNVLDIADGDMSDSDLEHFASTKRKSLPTHIKEAMDLGEVPFKVTYTDQNGRECTDTVTAPYYNAVFDTWEQNHPGWKLIKVGL